MTYFPTMIDPVADPAAETPTPTPAAEAPALDTATLKFDTCRWRSDKTSTDTPHCTHRDVLPLAGASGFKADAWCPDCSFFKVRRSPRKPNRSDGGSGGYDDGRQLRRT
jgi:hypothetical protein